MRRSLAPWPSLSALAGAVLIVCALATAARAETYGELGNFIGKVGTGHREFKITSGTHAFGVDPTDNSIYVGDELKKGEYRIQKLATSGAFLAETAPFKVPNHDGIEGIAVDPVEKRVYVLALEKRATTLTIDPSGAAAGALYAFSTEPSGEALGPAAGTSEGVLVGAGALEPQSDAPEAALLEPRGIAVDPTTHDVIVLAEVGLTTEEEQEPQLHVALERIHSSGALGERYVDGADFFSGLTPNSPVVSPKGAVYVAVDQAQAIGPKETEVADELMQIPSDFTSKASPTPFLQLGLRGTFEEETRPVVEFEDSQATVDGDGLSFAPESEGGTGEGTIYVKAHVFVGAPEEGAYYPGVLAFDGSDGAEIGWTGGQTKKSATSCTINFAGPTYSSIAAGKDGIVFVFDPGKESPFAAPRVVEFGPGGKGCPAAQASEPVAMVNGKPLSASETITAGTPIAFSSTLTQANALSVEWDFGDGQTQTDSADEYRHTEVKLAHGLVRGGELTVTETIHTDDLATPTIVEQTKVSVSATAPPPTAVLEGPSEVTLGGGDTLGRLEYLEGGGLGLEAAAQSEEATFDASASYASTATGPNSIETYHWVFGDGEADTTATATVKHKYKKAGVYRVELTVTDALGLTSEPSTLAVKVNEPSPGRPGGSGGSGNIPGAPGTGTVVATTTSAHASSAGASAGDAHNTRAVPDAGLASTSLVVGATGVVDLNVTCPAGESLCAGTIALRSLGAASASASSSSPSTGAKKRGTKALTLAAGKFTVAGGRTVSVKLRLSVRARMLLARSSVLRATATIVAHDPSGASHTTQRLVTLHAPKSTKRRSQD